MGTLSVETIGIVVELGTVKVWKAWEDAYIQDSIEHELNFPHDFVVIQKGTDFLHEYLKCFKYIYI